MLEYVKRRRIYLLGYMLSDETIMASRATECTNVGHPIYPYPTQIWPVLSIESYRHQYASWGR